MLRLFCCLHPYQNFWLRACSHPCNNPSSLYTLVKNHAHLDHLQKKCWWVRTTMLRLRQDKHYPFKLTKHNACPQKAVRQTKIFYPVGEFWGHALVVPWTVCGENCKFSTITYKVHEVISSSTNNRVRKWVLFFSLILLKCNQRCSYG